MSCIPTLTNFSKIWNSWKIKEFCIHTVRVELRNFSTMSCLLILVEYIYKERDMFMSSFGTALSLVCNFTLNEKINLKEKKQQKIFFN